MKKILFIIRKTSESAYKDCLESITALKMPAGYTVKNAPYEILVLVMLIWMYVRRKART